MHTGPYEGASGPMRSLRSDGGPSSGEARSWLPRASNAPYHQRDHSASSSVLPPMASPTRRLSRSASTSGPPLASVPPAMASSPVYAGDQHYAPHRQRAYTVQDDAPSSWSDPSALPSMHRSSDRAGAMDAPLPTLQSHPLLSEQGEPRCVSRIVPGRRFADSPPLSPLPPAHIPCISDSSLRTAACLASAQRTAGRLTRSLSSSWSCVTEMGASTICEWHSLPALERC